MRIVGGKFKGRRLAAPNSQNIRPTTDRTRESLFNILNNIFEFEGSRVIDLFAGTGALGLEAMSRGASFAFFVDESVEGRGLLRTNTQELGVQGACKISRRDATKIGEIAAMVPFDLAFLDPPYGKRLGEKAIAELIQGEWLKQDALIVLEEVKESFPDHIEGLFEADRRQFGDTMIGFYHLAKKF